MSNIYLITGTLDFTAKVQVLNRIVIPKDLVELNNIKVKDFVKVHVDVLKEEKKK